MKFVRFPYNVLDIAWDKPLFHLESMSFRIIWAFWNIASACGIRKRNLAHSITAEDVLTILLKADGSGWDPSTKDLKQETFYPLFRQNIEYRDFFHVRKPDWVKLEILIA